LIYKLPTVSVAAGFSLRFFKKMLVAAGFSLRFFKTRRLKSAATDLYKQKKLFTNTCYEVAELLTMTVCVLFLAPNIALAIENSPKDDQKTHLKANSAKFSRLNGENIGVYTGNATLNQGATTLQAQQIAIYETVGSKISKIVASGKHSHYSGMMEDNKKPVNADADNIIIVPEQDTMTLLGSAQIMTGQDNSDSSQKPINANADKVIIYSKQGMMNLSGNAQVMMGQDKYSGPYIDYQFK